MSTTRSIGVTMLPPHVAASRSALTALQREFARIRTLDHPNIGRVVELGSNGSQYFVTAERLDGEPLRDVLTHLLPERLAVGESDEIVRAIGSALSYAHDRGIPHGDVRAENVVVTMDRRFVLTNFLARRVAKTATRPPRPSDDVRGLARLAAELYTGSPSVQALRSAAHGEIPAARLNAIRTVLEMPSRRAGSIEDFLDAAGLPLVTLTARPRGARSSERATAPARSWSLWRLVMPLGALAAVGLFVTSYHGDWGASAEELRDLGLGALRAVTAQVAPSAGNAPPREPAQAEAAPLEEDLAAVATSDTAAEVPEAAAPVPGEPQRPLEAHDTAPLLNTGEQPAETPVASDDPPAHDPPTARRAAAQPPARAIERTAAGAARLERSARSSSHAGREPPIVALGVPRIAAREDHSVVALEIVRTGDLTGEVAVSWWIVPGSAQVDDDYVDLGRRTVTFPPGSSVQRVLIPLVNDGVRESPEDLTLHLGSPRGGVAGPLTTARITLHDDD